MTIKEVEERTGLTRSNIRFYEKEKLIEPSRNVASVICVWSSSVHFFAVSFASLSEFFPQPATAAVITPASSRAAALDMNFLIFYITSFLFAYVND